MESEQKQNIIDMKSKLSTLAFAQKDAEADLAFLQEKEKKLLELIEDELVDARNNYKSSMQLAIMQKVFSFGIMPTLASALTIAIILANHLFGNIASADLITTLFKGGVLTYLGTIAATYQLTKNDQISVKELKRRLFVREVDIICNPSLDDVQRKIDERQQQITTNAEQMHELHKTITENDMQVSANSATTTMSAMPRENEQKHVRVRSGDNGSKGYY